MKNQETLWSTFARSVLIVSVGVLAIAALFIVARFSKHAPEPAAAAEPEAAASIQEVVAEPEAPPAEEADATPVEEVMLRELPKVEVTRAPDCPLRDLKVSFKLDSRLTKSLYMGDRWLSPPTYLQVGAGDHCTVEASIRGLNAQGKAVNIPATWQVADPFMVDMSEPGRGNTVKFTVVRPGQTTIEIAAQGITKRLPLHARSYGGTLMVAMAQQ